jgi:hypothetical protein
MRSPRAALWVQIPLPPRLSGWQTSATSLSHLRRDPFASYENLGREVGLSGRAVRTRLEALESRKNLTSLQAVPAAQLFERQPRL